MLKDEEVSSGMEKVEARKPLKNPSQRQPTSAVPVSVARSPSLLSLSNGSILLQRQPSCACGGGCPRCQGKTVLQTKLQVSEPGDRYEQEADLIADQVMRMTEPLQKQVESKEEDEEEMVQRKAIANQVASLDQTQKSSEVPPLVHETLNSPGQSLDPKASTFMESRFGYDFSQVRVHTDAKAADSAKAVHALAYTVGQNIVFGEGQYEPQTQTGLKVLAHELSHVLQQRGLRSKLLQRQQPPAPAQPLDPAVAQARADASYALSRTAERVEHAINTRDNNLPVPHDVDEALTRFFPGTSHGDLEELLARIKPMVDWIQKIPVRPIIPVSMSPIIFPPGTPHAAEHGMAINIMPAIAIAAPDLPPPNYIGLYPAWYADQALQATRLLHEAYHFSYPTIRGHDPNQPWTNPFAYQRFVSIVGGLAFR